MDYYDDDDYDDDDELSSSTLSCPERRGLSRLLSLVRAYIEKIEGLYTEPRSILPHGATFRGAPLTVSVQHESAEEPLSVQVRTELRTDGQMGWGIWSVFGVVCAAALVDLFLDV